MSDHEIYARNLLSDKGFAPWRPRPVNIAEVGYVARGGWIPLFNASKKPGDVINKLGVPYRYHPMDVGELDTSMLSSVFPITNERGTSLEFGIKGSSAAIAVTSAEAQYTFTSSKQEGAILVPGGNIDVADALEHSKYVRYIRENYASWLEFANKRHNRGIRLIDLVLVTGWHKTASWACAAFSQCSREINLTFHVGVGATQGGVWGKWSDIVSPGVWGHSGPPRTSLKVDQPTPPENDKSRMEIEDLENIKLPARSEQMEGAYQHCSADVQALGTDSTDIRDQGVFIRGYKICDRHTGLARIFHRNQCLKHGKDGFTFIPPSDHDEIIRSIDDDHNRGDEDTDRDGDPSSSRQDPPSGGPGSSFSSSSRSQGGAMSGDSDGKSGPSSSSHMNHLSHGFKLDDDLVLYLQLNRDKEPTAVEIILEYILENSTAEFSLAHDNDVTELLQDGIGTEDFAAEIRKISPRIFVVDEVGMLYRTSLIMSADRGKEYVTQGMPSTTAYVSHILQTKPSTDPLPEYSQTDQPIKSTGRSSQFPAPITPNTFEPSPLSYSWAPSPFLSNTTAPISVPEVPDPASERKIAIDKKDNDVGNTFNERQRTYFDNLIRKKWECPLEGHTVCVPTKDKQHFRLKDHNIRYWVNALCKGTATTSEPPLFVFKDIAGGPVWNRDNGNSIIYAVSVAPSRTKPGSNHNPVGNRARSVVSTDDVQSGSLISSDGGSIYMRSMSVTSHVPGPGYFGGRVIKWLGEKSMNTIQHTLIVRRARSHVSTLEQWTKHRVQLGVAEQAKVFEMLGDALEMSRSDYSRSENKHGYIIGRSVHYWLHSYRGIPESKEQLSWFIKVQISLVPIFLSRISRVDPVVGDLAYETLAAVTKVPLAVQNEETTATIIWLIARELAYAKCSFQHSWLGIWLLRIVNMSLRVRNLSHIEVSIIKELAVRREEQSTDYNMKQEDVWRPWEVALFARCASQDTWFKDAVTGTQGLPDLVDVLDSMLAQDVLAREVRWEIVALITQALAFLSEHDWVVDVVDPTVIELLLQVFRQNIPERWFCIQFWAADTMLNMVAHRPRFIQNLLREEAESIFEALLNPQLDHELSSDKPQLVQLKIRRPHIPFVSSNQSPIFSSHSSVSSIESSLQFSFEYLSCPLSLIRPPRDGDEHVIRRDITYNSRSGTTSNDGTPIRSPRHSRTLLSLGSRLSLGREWPMEDYKMHTIERTKELLDYIEKWPRWSL